MDDPLLTPDERLEMALRRWWHRWCIRCTLDDALDPWDLAGRKRLMELMEELAGMPVADAAEPSWPV